MSRFQNTINEIPKSVADTPLQSLIGDMSTQASGDPEPSSYCVAWSDFAVCIRQSVESKAVLDLDALTGEGTFNSEQTLSEIFQKLQDTGLDKVEGNISVKDNGKPVFQVK